MQEIASTVALVGILVFLAHLFTGIFSRTRIPDVLLLIIIGICFGPLMNLTSPDEFGIVGPVFTTITLIVILFESGLTLRLSAIRTTLGSVMKLAPFSFFVTMGGVAGLAILLTDLELLPAFILGAIVSSTSEAVVIPLIRQIKVQEETRTLLSVESSVNDVLSIVITVALVQAYTLGQLNIPSISGNLFAAFIVAMVFGVIGALIWSTLLNRIHALKNAMFTTPAFVFVIFGAVEMLGFSGPIAALAFGITIGNIESIRVPIFKKSLPGESVGLTEAERLFFSEVAFLLKAFFFIYLGISLELISNWLIIVSIALCALVFVLRLFSVKVTVRKSYPKLDISIASIMIPKGLAAVVLASIPLQQQVAGGETIKNITYGVVLLSIIITSVLGLFMEKTKLVDFYGWILSSKFPRIRPRIALRPKEITSEENPVIPSGSRLFKGTDDTPEKPADTEE